MGIVELDADFLGKTRPLELPACFLCVCFVSSDDVLESGADQQVLLLESQFLPGISRVIRVQHTSDVLCSLPGFQGVVILTSVEGIEIEFIQRQGLP